MLIKQKECYFNKKHSYFALVNTSLIFIYQCLYLNARLFIKTNTTSKQNWYSKAHA